MRLSFIKPRPKHLFSWEIRLLLSFFALIFFVLFVLYAYIEFKLQNFEDEMINSRMAIERLGTESIAMQKHIDFIIKQSNQAKQIYKDNKLLADSIKNLFNIVPDTITLVTADLGKNSLVLRGRTPTKEVYKFMLLAPLRAIFDHSYTTYYQLSNGWYNFVSTNKMDKVKEQEAVNE
ncbi:MAG: hypothetical protein OEW60_06250 [Thiovulaceae bacterium]|nr:hypothetical protein [Sulfurimonadaceae bacterium]